VEIVDISVPIRPGMIVYEGDPDVHLERVLSIADGARANQPARLRGVRSATHVDAPVHFIDSAGGTEALPLDALVGDPYVVDATAAETMIDEETLRELRLPEGAEVASVQDDELAPLGAHCIHARLRPAAGGARFLVARGVRLVGTDYLWIDDENAHRELLSAGVVVVEASTCAASTRGD
jgi:arylformamidase